MFDFVCSSASIIAGIFTTQIKIKQNRTQRMVSHSNLLIVATAILAA
jgi:hypothetical protein